MQEILIKSLMTKEVQCVSSTTPFSHVIQAMKENRYSCMVITENKAPVGILTERDVVHHFADLVQRGRAYDPDVASIMSTQLVTVDENADFFQALVISRSNQIRHLPVVNGKHELVGLVTYTDLVAAHSHVIGKQTEILEREVAYRTQALQEANKKLHDLSMEDALLRI